MKVGSLFSGIGGIEIGFEQEGYTTEWFVERDSYAKEILRKRFPNAIIYDDVTKIDFGNVPKIDVLTGGFPCQDISNAGKRTGIEGSRSSLWKYYLEAIREIRPKYALIENVSALIGRGLDVVLADLASIGYDAEWHCISASSVGAPHRRDRIFIIAYPSGSREYWEQCEESISEEGRNNELADPNSSGHVHKQFEKYSDKNGEQTQCDSYESYCDIPYPESFRCNWRERCGYSNNKGWKICEDEQENGVEIWGKIGGGGSENGSRQYERFKGWAIEPRLGRVAHGVPLWVDRIKCLGNAVVPQCAQIFAKAIKEVVN